MHWYIHVSTCLSIYPCIQLWNYPLHPISHSSIWVQDWLVMRHKHSMLITVTPNTGYATTAATTSWIPSAKKHAGMQTYRGGWRGNRKHKRLKHVRVDIDKWLKGGTDLKYAAVLPVVFVNPQPPYLSWKVLNMVQNVPQGVGPCSILQNIYTLYVLCTVVQRTTFDKTYFLRTLLSSFDFANTQWIASRQPWRDATLKTIRSGW